MNTTPSTSLIFLPQPINKLEECQIKSNVTDSRNISSSKPSIPKKPTIIKRKRGRPPKRKRGPKSKEVVALKRKEKIKVLFKCLPHLVTPIQYIKNKLVCKACNKAVSCKTSTLRRHITSSRHINSATRIHNEKVIQMLKERKRKMEKANDNYFIYQSLMNCLALGLAMPLYETDEKRVEPCNDAQEAKMLPSDPLIINTYIPGLASVFMDRISGYLYNEEISLCIDETKNIKDQSVVSIMVKKLNGEYENEPYFFLGMYKIEDHSSDTICSILLDVFCNFRINPVRMKVFNSDDSDSMINVAKRFAVLSSDCTWIGCLCHILDLIGNELISGFDDCSKFMDFCNKKIRNNFRCFNLLKHFLHKSSWTPTDWPLFISTRWDSWMSCYSYYKLYFDDICSFILQNKDKISQFDDFCHLLTDDVKQKIRDAFKILDSIYIEIHDIISIISSDSNVICNSKILIENIYMSLCSLETTINSDQSIDDKIKKSISNAKLQVEMYFISHDTEEEPYRILYENTVLFNPYYVAQLPLYDLTKYTLFNSVPKEEFNQYLHKCRTFSLSCNCKNKYLCINKKDYIHFFNSNVRDFPTICSIALKYKHYPCNLTYLERLCSQYKRFLTFQRKSMSDKNEYNQTIIYMNSNDPIKKEILHQSTIGL
ncbi:hypothetical protein WA158_004081 [Blastocystis sp. Blastoise]